MVLYIVTTILISVIMVCEYMHKVEKEELKAEIKELKGKLEKVSE